MSILSLRFALQIARAEDEVFAVVSELENDVKWQSAVIGVRKLTRGMPRPGSRYVHRIDVLGNVMETASEFLSFDRSRVYSIRSVCGPFAFETSVHFSREAGGTHLDVLIEGQAANAFTRLAAIALSGHRRKEIAHDLERLKQLLESRAL